MVKIYLKNMLCRGNSLCPTTDKKESASIADLNPVVVSVRHHDVFVSAQAEPMGGVELTFFSTKLPELRPYLHSRHRNKNND